MAVLAMLALARPPDAAGAGYAVDDRSASAAGTAFAGATAGTDDASYLTHNPAALAPQDGNRLIGGGTIIVPSLDLRRGAASTGSFGPGLGSVRIGGETRADAAVPAVVPALFALWSVTPDLKLGLGVTSPFGLTTEYPRDWVGRYHAVRSELLTLNFNPVVAYRATSWLGLGAGLQLQYLKATLTNAVDVGSVAFALTGGRLGTPAGNDGFAKLTADDWDVGFTLGVLVEPWASTQLGVAYRSPVRHRLTGTADFTVDPVGSALTSLSTVRGRGLFADTSASASVETPETVSVGVRHRLSPRWTVMAEAAWTHWARFDRLVVRFGNPDQPDDVTRVDWKDTWLVALGTTYQLDERWQLRAGAAYDQAPMPDRTREPRIPDADRLRLAVGMTVAVTPRLTINLAYSHVFLESAPLRLTASGEGNQFRGNLSGTYSNRIDIGSIQAVFRF
jgi:long-chain fatty acid transport protein